MSSTQEKTALRYRDTTDQEPFDFYDRARAGGGVEWDESMNAWLVTSYDACKELEREEEKTYRHGYLAMETDVFVEVEGGPGNIVFLTGEEQRNLHRAFIKVLQPALIERWRDELVNPILDDLIGRFKADGEVELWTELCDKFPVRVITAVCGLPYDDEAWVENCKWEMDEIAAFLQAHGTEDEDAVRRGLEASRRIDAMLMPTVEARRENPGDDLISRLWTECDKLPTPLSATDMLTNVRVLIFGGSDTLSHVLANACHILMTQPELQDTLREGDDKVIANFVEEALRLLGAAHFRPRVAAEDVTLGGAEVKKGDSLLTIDLAANRDEKHYACPHQVDLERPAPRDHFAFHFGPRTCVGSQLARAELQCAIRKIVDQLRDLRFDTTKEPPSFHGFMLRGYHPLHSTFTPA
jgi:cytochrome P450